MRGGELAAGSDADSLALGLDLVVHRGEKVDDWEGRHLLESTDAEVASD